MKIDHHYQKHHQWFWKYCLRVEKYKQQLNNYKKTSAGRYNIKAVLLKKGTEKIAIEIATIYNEIA